MTRGKLVAPNHQKVEKVTTAPEEPQGGQETEPPDLRLMVLALITLLQDLDLAARQRRPLGTDEGLRILALLAVLRRFRRKVLEP